MAHRNIWRRALKEADAFQRLVCGVTAWQDTSSPSSLKEADAFQRLVCETPLARRVQPSFPQRSRRLSASGIRRRRQFRRTSIHPSKKQTPFSVWYAELHSHTPRVFRFPQRSRRLSASGMRLPGGRRGDSRYPSKKQTPFSVWYP